MSTARATTRISFVAALSLLATSATLANNVSTSFEFTDLSGSFTRGTPPTTATFTGGEAKTIGVFSLYHTGTHAWMITPGNTGTITFGRPAASVDLFVRDQFATVNGVLTVFDTNGAVITTVNSKKANWTEVTVTRDPNQPAIGSITLTHNGATGHTVIDDFTYCAVGTFDDPNTPGLDDPIVAPIPAGPVHIMLETVATGLTAPNWGTSAPGITGRLFVTDQNGTVWNIDLDTGAKSAFLDVSTRLVPLGIFGPGSFDERGLLGLAFHPNYATNGLVYTYTSQPIGPTPDFSTMPPGRDPNHLATITEWHVPQPTNPDATVDPNSARVLLRVAEPQFNHNAGALNFDAAGRLYISLGDGGGADDMDRQFFITGPIFGHGSGNGQDNTNPLGSILRIDPLGNDSANGQYGIPLGNPFTGAMDPGVDEIFAYGFRNPFRFSFDQSTGDLYVGDVGQNDIEEIDIVTAGGNYGWNAMEGTFVFDADGNNPGFVTADPPPPGLTLPIAEYDHDEGLAIIGGFVYRGARVPPLVGRYVFGDFARTFNNDGRLFHLDAGGQVVEFPLVGQAQLGMSLLGFGQDADGEVYVMANATGTPFGTTGMVLRIALRAGDIDGDGSITVSDLGALLAAFGTCEGDPAFNPAADFDRSGCVDISDLGTLLAVFGQ